MKDTTIFCHLNGRLLSLIRQQRIQSRVDFKHLNTWSNLTGSCCIRRSEHLSDLATPHRNNTTRRPKCLVLLRRLVHADLITCWQSSQRYWNEWSHTSDWIAPNVYLLLPL